LACHPKSISNLYQHTKHTKSTKNTLFFTLRPKKSKKMARSKIRNVPKGCFKIENLSLYKHLPEGTQRVARKLFYSLCNKYQDLSLQLARMDLTKLESYINNNGAVPNCVLYLLCLLHEKTGLPHQYPYDLTLALFGRLTKNLSYLYNEIVTELNKTRWWSHLRSNYQDRLIKGLMRHFKARHEFFSLHETPLTPEILRTIQLNTKILLSYRYELTLSKARVTKNVDPRLLKATSTPKVYEDLPLEGLLDPEVVDEVHAKGLDLDELHKDNSILNIQNNIKQKLHEIQEDLGFWRNNNNYDFDSKRLQIVDKLIDYIAHCRENLPNEDII
jgi:hypothetical protein